MKSKSFLPFLNLQKFPQWLNISDFWMVLTLLGITTLTFLPGDRINVGEGFGWDSYLFGTLAQDFYERFNEGVNQFWASRVFPSWMIYHILQWLPIEATPQNVIRAFSILNIICITLVGYIWVLIARELNISIRGKWLGFICLFLNFNTLKAMSYLPVKTDIVGYALGMVMLYGYLKKRTILLYLCTLIGSFTWPAIIHLGTLMLLFPRKLEADREPTPKSSQTIKYNLHRWLPLIPAIAGGIYMNELLPGDLDYLNRGKPLQSVGYLSIAIATAYVFFGLSEILRDSKLFQWQTWQYYFKQKSFYLTFIGLLVVSHLPSILATAPGKDSTLGHLLYLVVLTSILQPGVFFLAHIIYWGPCIILMAFLWRPLCQMIHQYGLALTLWVAMSLPHSLDSESRHFVTFFPLLIPFLVKLIEQMNWKKWQYWGFAIASLLVSKVWLTIGPIHGDFREFPSQMFFMSEGPWISNTMYMVQGACAIFLSYWLYDFYLRKRSS